MRFGMPGFIAENPLRNAVRFDDVRRLNLKRFPYSIWNFASNEATYVLGVFHNKRDHRRLLNQRRKQVKRCTRHSNVKDGTNVGRSSSHNSETTDVHS